uniref:Uncharacterized protein n=1 Tax=Mucochytrium quahogii TaxID=96639 RepID=A0A7S2RX55_9STRA|mmetsp:Transcript_17547/g.28403  ORF Transcript_17547/g.28403 Transcript_17547/m.28403 type:complete len:135 (+) Transcript_17547:169-573(+)
MTAVCSEGVNVEVARNMGLQDNSVVFVESEREIARQLAVRIAARMDEVCAYCPDFLLSTVLEGLLKDVLEKRSTKQLSEVYFYLANTHVPKNLNGFVLGLQVLKWCIRESPETCFAKLGSLSSEEIKAWRVQLL